VWTLCISAEVLIIVTATFRALPQSPSGQFWDSRPTIN
jgi:hypothetical protein